MLKRFSKNYSTKLKKVNLTQKGLKVLKMKMPKENLIAQKSEYNDMTWNYAAAYQLSQITNVQLHFQYKYYQH